MIHILNTHKIRVCTLMRIIYTKRTHTFQNEWYDILLFRHSNRNAPINNQTTNIDRTKKTFTPSLQSHNVQWNLSHWRSHHHYRLRHHCHLYRSSHCLIKFMHCQKLFVHLVVYRLDIDQWWSVFWFYTDKGI